MQPATLACKRERRQRHAQRDAGGMPPQNAIALHLPHEGRREGAGPCYNTDRLEMNALNKYHITDTVEICETNDYRECNEYINMGWKLLQLRNEGGEKQATVYILARPSSLPPRERPNCPDSIKDLPGTWPKNT